MCLFFSGRDLLLPHRLPLVLPHTLLHRPPNPLMFTPPPSPEMPRRGGNVSPPSRRPEEQGSADIALYPSLSPYEIKRRLGRRTKFCVILIPLVLVLITASTRYLAHPTFFDFLAEPPAPEWQPMAPSISNWTIHRRHPFPQDSSPAATRTSTSSGTAFPSAAPSTTRGGSASTTATATSDLPTIPASPPVLPTPFPQPYDTSFQKNFTSPGCYDFFVNMTNTAPFRSCRPFSLLLQSSAEFIDVIKFPSYFHHSTVPNQPSVHPKLMRRLSLSRLKQTSRLRTRSNGERATPALAKTSVSRIWPGLHQPSRPPVQRTSKPGMRWP